VAALERLGQRDFEVHTGRSVPGDLGELVCFAGRGPGEVLHSGRKVVGLSQWRSREGALFSTCAYERWDPAGLMALLDVDDTERGAIVSDLASSAVGVGELQPAARDLEALGQALLSSFDGWTAVGGGASAGS
jgi:lipoate-protein ligase A